MHGWPQVVFQKLFTSEWHGQDDEDKPPLGEDEEDGGTGSAGGTGGAGSAGGKAGSAHSKANPRRKLSRAVSMSFSTAMGMGMGTGKDGLAYAGQKKQAPQGGGGGSCSFMAMLAATLQVPSM